MFNYITYINFDIIDRNYDHSDIEKELHDFLKNYGNVNQIFFKNDYRRQSRQMIMLDMFLQESYYNDLIEKEYRYGDRAYINTVLCRPLHQNFRIYFN